MRTPIGQIIGYAELLQEDALDADQSDLARDLWRIRSAAQRLLEYVNGICRPAFAGLAPAQGEPVAEAADPAASMPRGAEAVAEGTKGTLLIVDDDAGNLDLLARRLEASGYTVEVAEDGRSALRRLEEQPFDLVLLDVLMPGMSGIEVLEAIRHERDGTELPVIMATALGGSEDTVEALRRGANDYVTKPFDLPVVLARVETQLSLARAAGVIHDLAMQLEIRNAFIRQIFGRYVSNEVVTNLLESPDGLELKGEKRRVTILLADLRGFSVLTEALSPVSVVSVLNNFLGAMSEVIQAYGGTIDEFIGDAILALFGAPETCADYAERAVACAISMQLAMESVNEKNRAMGLPEVEMGIGIATGDVIVGNIGSERRTKYGAVGSTVNLAARIESTTLGGEILISEETRTELGTLGRLDSEREIHPKGFGASLRIHRVVGMGGRHDLFLAQDGMDFVELEDELPVRLALLEGKQVGSRAVWARISAISARGARLRSEEPLPELSDVRLELLDEHGVTIPGVCYAKVVEAAVGLEGLLTLRFTSRTALFVEFIEQVLVRGRR